MKEKFEQEQKDRQNHIEDLIPDMPDMEDDEKFRQWLEETYINEAELIEKSLLAGQEYEKNPDIAEELSVPREKFYQRLKEEGLYEETDEPDDTSEFSKKVVRGVGTEIAGDAVAKKNNDSVSKTAREKIISMEARTSKEAGGAAWATEGYDSPVKTETVAVSDIEVSSEKSSKNDRPVRKKRSYLRLGKVAGVAGVCLMCVFAASMTSEANRNYWVRGFKYLTGNDTKVIIGNDKENEDINSDEYEAIQNIEKKLEIKVPEFYYRPDGMKFWDYQISEETSAARIEYQYKDTILMFYINKQSEDRSSHIYSLHGDEQERIIAGDEKTEVVIDKVYDEGEEMPSYTASWTKNDMVFILSGRVDIEELRKIIKYMKF